MSNGESPDLLLQTLWARAGAMVNAALAEYGLAGDRLDEAAYRLTTLVYSGMATARDACERMYAAEDRLKAALEPSAN